MKTGLSRPPSHVPPASRISPARLSRRVSVAQSVFVFTALIFLTGCTLLRRDPTPGRTRLESPLVTVPVKTIANVLFVEMTFDKRGTWRFLLDTGSSVTLVSPEFARFYATDQPSPTTPQVRVRAASGQDTLLSAVTVRRLEVGGARFDRVPALIYDFEELSAHFGEKIDGVLGFPVFRQTILTLDYPNSRILLAPAGGASALQPGSRVAFDTATKTPLIPIEIDGQTLVALIDSGSDSGLHLNPVGLETRINQRPIPGGVIATLAGERPQEIGRLDGLLRIGDYRLPKPVTDLTDELSSIGGGILRHFVVTFDQDRGDVTFFRESSAPIPSPSPRTSGLSFTKTEAYWRVAAVVPGSPADAEGIQVGDLLVRIDGEPVSDWPLQRLEARVATAELLDFTFLDGLIETTRTLPVFDLVP